jgi:hypothetical protein
MSYPIENAVFQWEEGYRALERSRQNPRAYRALGRAVVAVEDRLRKRLGSRFSIAELASLYRESGDWEIDLPGARSDEEPTIDPAIAVDAAFFLYMREAADFAGGSRRPARR